MCHSHLDVGDVIVTARGNYVEITAENADGSVSAVFVSHQDVSKIGDTVRYASHGGHVLCAGGDGVCRHHDDDTQYTIAHAGQRLFSKLPAGYHQQTMQAARRAAQRIAKGEQITAQVIESAIRGGDESVTVSAHYRVSDRAWVVFMREPVSLAEMFTVIVPDEWSQAGLRMMGIFMRRQLREAALAVLSARPAATITMDDFAVDETKDERARLPMLIG